MSAPFNNLPPNFIISEDKTYATLSTPLEKSENDDRKYRLIVLPNNLEALLISDSETDKSSAAIGVHVGQINDPVNALSNIVLMCFYGVEPLDQLNQWVVEKFSKVKNKAIPIPVPKEHYPLTEKELRVQSIASIDFRFQEKYSPSYYTSKLAVQMQRPYPRELILSGSHLIREYNPELILEGLNCLCWDKCIITLSSKLLKGLDKKEKWFGTEYKLEKISEELLKIHPPNIFVPSNFEVDKLIDVVMSIY
ncbi:12592_t:CDS:2, partial [Racocetra fulgida]